MPKLVLTDDQGRAILDAPDSESTAALAHRIDAPYPATYRLRALIRQGAWRCRLALGTSDPSGVISPAPPRHES